MTLPYALRKSGKIRKFIRTIHVLAEAGKKIQTMLWKKTGVIDGIIKNNRIRIIKDKTGFV